MCVMCIHVCVYVCVFVFCVLSMKLFPLYKQLSREERVDIWQEPSSQVSHIGMGLKGKSHSEADRASL